MKLTLLQIVQDMLSAIDAENVSSVGDTAESGMCVNIANRCFESIIYKYRWRHLRGYHRLVASTNNNDLAVPSGTIALDPFNVYYNQTRISYIEPEDFLSMVMARDSTDTTTYSIIDDLPIYKSTVPQYFTSSDDTLLTFDGQDNATDGLNAALTKALCYVAPTSRLSTDGEYFNLPAIVYPALNTFCIGTAVNELKGDPQAGQLLMRQSMADVARLARTARLIDKEDDIRKWIVPRRSQFGATTINAGNGLFIS